MLGDISTLTGHELLDQLDDVAARVADDAGGNERLIVEHGGRRFALVSLEDLQYLEQVDQQLDDNSAAGLQATAGDPDRQQTVPFNAPAAR